MSTEDFTIELRLRDVNQLFNSLDPSPFHEKDLDGDAEEFIVSWARECPPDRTMRLAVYIDGAVRPDTAAVITDAVHNYFRYRAQISRFEFRDLMKRGRISLAIGLTCLFASLILSRLLLTDPSHPLPWIDVVRESITIAGWVAMWHPVELYLYGWWPIRRQGRLLSRLATMPVQVLPR